MRRPAFGADVVEALRSSVDEAQRIADLQAVTVDATLRAMRFAGRCYAAGWSLGWTIDHLR